MKRKRKQSLYIAQESETQNAICEYLELKRYFFWRQNSVGVYDPVKKSYRRLPKYARKGVPDIIVVRNGVFIGIEVKKQGMYQSKDQKIFERDLVEAGGKYLVARGLQDVIDFGI